MELENRNRQRRIAVVLAGCLPTAPEGGKANAAVRKLLAAALGVAKSHLTLIRGQSSRTKVFRVDI